MIQAILVAASAVLQTATLQQTIVFETRVSEVASLGHHLDCMAGEIACTRGPIRDFWQHGWSPQDDSAIARWRALHARYRTDAPLEDRPEVAYPLNTPGHGSIDIPEKLRLAALLAGDARSYEAALQMVMTPADARTATAVLQRFLPRFHVWWESKAQAQLQSAAKSMQPHIEARDLSNLLSGVARFFDAQLPDTLKLVLDLVALPPGRAGASATQVENHSVIEVPEGDAPANRLPVFVHEIVHYLYAQAPAREHARIVEFFVNAKEPDALASYNILNEALATAIGNGIVERMMRGPERFETYAAQPRSFYNDDFIDGAGKALLPITETALRAGRRLDDAFLRAYLAAFSVALGPRATSPLLSLKHIAAFDASPGASNARRKLTDAIRPGSMYVGPSSFARYPRLGGVVFALSSDLNNAELTRVFGAAMVQQVKTEAARSGAFVLGAQRPGGAALYWFVGRDAAELEALVNAFLKADAPFLGVRFVTR